MFGIEGAGPDEAGGFKVCQISELVYFKSETRRFETYRMTLILDVRWTRSNPGSKAENVVMNVFLIIDLLSNLA